ncbi:hypothetical protein [Amycolatopsis sp. NPDC059657]|uniref:hypothetical protein n=1 Tax=Amycolatopsis sp. NPDC059657 TaxID=3346899 RepID=UPI00366CB093
MIGWAVFALVILGLLVAVVVTWLWSEHLAVQRRARAIAKYQPEHTVAAIQMRIAEEEAAERLSEAPTEVIPVMATDDVPTEVLPAVLPVRRKRRYVQRPTPYPRNRKDLRPPDRDLMHRVLDGLKRLD